LKTLSREIIETKIKEILEELNFPSSSIKDSTTLKDDLGFDEIDMVEVVMEIEEKFNIVFPNEVTVETFGELTEYVIKNIEQANAGDNQPSSVSGKTES